MIFDEFDLLASYPFKSRQPVFVDVGAHRGGVSFKFASKGWRVIAFEPEPKNRAAFERTLVGFDKVICIPKAVSDITGDKLPFYASEEHSGIHSLKPFHKTHRLAFEVETVALKDVLADLNISAVTLLKVDIEGADFLALKGFDFSRYQPELGMIEFMDERTSRHFGYTHHDVVAYMRKVGYVTFISERGPIIEYAREGVATMPPEWLQCVPYPLDHEPVTGNLVFVPENDADKFSIALQIYLANLKREASHNIFMEFRKQIKRIPGAKLLYRALKRR